jgi:hypothetical protein
MRPFVDEPVSPELVLVDPELAARLRPFAIAGPALEPPPAAPAARPVEAIEEIEPPAPLRAPVPPEPEPAESGDEPAEPAARVESTPHPVPAARRQTTVAGRLLQVVGVLAGAALLGVAFLPPRDAPRLVSNLPSASAATSTRVTLAWTAADDASYYLVEVFRGRTLVHAETTGATRLVTPAWLEPGRYTWRVFAGRGAPSERDTVGPLDNGWFRITAS